MKIEYILLGLLQGITEPIPVSSSGHLKLFQKLFNLNAFNDLNFEIIVNFGSLLAILIIFRKDIIKIVRGFFNFLFKKTKEDYDDFRYGLCIIIASIPIGILGFLLKDVIEKKLSNINILAVSFIITAISLFLVRNIKGSKNDEKLTIKDAIIIGLFQIVAIFPGISRSGITLVGCLFRDLKRESALKFTFMLYIPVSIATFALGLFDIIKGGQLNVVLMPYTIGLIVSLLATLVSYNFLSKLVKNGKLIVFSIYCLILSGIILFFL